jgi:hypothetical protein
MFPPCSMPSFSTIYSLSWRLWASYPSLNVTPSCSPNQGCDELESNVTQQLMGLRGSPSMRMTATRRSGKRALGAVTARPSAGTGTPFGCRLPGR